jgi:hypothetical protein
LINDIHRGLNEEGGRRSVVFWEVTLCTKLHAITSHRNITLMQSTDFSTSTATVKDCNYIPQNKQKSVQFNTWPDNINRTDLTLMPYSNLQCACFTDFTDSVIQPYSPLEKRLKEVTFRSHQKATEEQKHYGSCQTCQNVKITSHYAWQCQVNI